MHNEGNQHSNDYFNDHHCSIQIHISIIVQVGRTKIEVPNHFLILFLNVWMKYNFLNFKMTLIMASYNNFIKMNRFLLLVILLYIEVANSQQKKITASLSLISFDPLKLNLTFSQPLPLPEFQLLLNEIRIKYNVIDGNVTSSSYILQGGEQAIASISQDTEKFVLLFVQPLRVGNGRLSLNSFLLRAKKSVKKQFYSSYNFERQIFYKYQNYSPTFNALAIAIVSIVYFLAFTTLIGMHAYNFLAIFTFICLRSPIYTALGSRCAYLLLFEVNQVADNYRQRVFYMMIPHISIALSFVVGLISRFAFSRLANRSGLCKQIYYYFSYKFFIITWEIMCIPILANVTHLITQKDHFGNISTHWLYIYLYFSVVLILFYSYMAYLTANPQICEPASQWQLYIRSPHYQLFDGFHLGNDAKNWKKRNFTFIVSIMRNAIIILVACQLVNVPNLLSQIFYLIYLFTLRPFKYDFFNYIITGIQVFVIVFYLFRYLVQLYMWISDEIITSGEISNILLADIIFLCLITFAYFILGAYQFYQRLIVFRANVTVWARKAMLPNKETDRELLRMDSNRTEFRKQASIIITDTGSPSQKKVNKKFIPSPELSSPHSGSRSPLNSPKSKNLRKKQSNQTNLSNPQLIQIIDKSERNQSSFRDKSPRKIKQKQSLLQTISLGQSI